MEPVDNKKVRRSAALYFAVQGAAVFAWWLALYIEPGFRRYFVLERSSETSLLAFWLSDIAFLGVGSWITAWLCFKGISYRQIAAWFVAGAFAHATIYSLAFALIADSGWLGVTLMFPAMIWSGVFAIGLSFQRTMFRAAADTSTTWIIVKTFTQVVVVWSIILGIFPYLITVVERKLGIAAFSFSYQRPLSTFFFCAISLLGLYAAYVMSRIGKGTPLPLDHARKLVVLGPYAFVRNPMAVSGVGQGIAVALFLGSPLVALYALMGSLVWQLIFRPLEENDLEMRFGAEYREYRDRVKCWIPSLDPFRVDNSSKDNRL